MKINLIQILSKKENLLKNIKILKEILNKPDNWYFIFGITKKGNNVLSYTLFYNNNPVYWVIYFDEQLNILRSELYNPQYDDYEYHNSEHSFISTRLKKTKENTIFIDFYILYYWNVDKDYYKEHSKKYSIPNNNIIMTLIILFNNQIQMDIKKQINISDIDIDINNERISKIYKDMQADSEEFKKNQGLFREHYKTLLILAKEMNYISSDKKYFTFDDILRIVNTLWEYLPDFSIYEEDYRAPNRIRFRSKWIEIELHPMRDKEYEENLSIKKINDSKNWWSQDKKWIYYKYQTLLINKLIEVMIAKQQIAKQQNK